MNRRGFFAAVGAVVSRRAVSHPVYSVVVMTTPVCSECGEKLREPSFNKWGFDVWKRSLRGELVECEPCRCGIRHWARFYRREVAKEKG